VRAALAGGKPADAIDAGKKATSKLSDIQNGDGSSSIDYFKANSAKTENDITVEVDRYIVWPGQALAYKLGQLKIRELRAESERLLGAKFNVRAFHDAVLEQGAVPLSLLEPHVRHWMDSQAAK